MLSRGSLGALSSALSSAMTDPLPNLTEESALDLSRVWACARRRMTVWPRCRSRNRRPWLTRCPAHSLVLLTIYGVSAMRSALSYGLSLLASARGVLTVIPLWCLRGGQSWPGRCWACTVYALCLMTWVAYG